MMRFAVESGVIGETTEGRGKFGRGGRGTCSQKPLPKHSSDTGSSLETSLPSPMVSMTFLTAITLEFSGMHKGQILVLKPCFK